MILTTSFFSIIFLLLLSIRKNKYSDILFNKVSSGTINGFFVLLVFISHFKEYITISTNPDLITVKIFYAIGQLMVTTFLFFTGYGILSSIKNEGFLNRKKMLQRFINVWVSFSVAIIIYLITAFIFKDDYSIKQIVLSFVAWDTIGNSAWYMFAVFSLYISTLFAMFFSNSVKKLIKNVFLFTAFVYIFLRLTKESHWYNTLFCYPFGMYVKNNEEKIISRLNSNWLPMFLVSILTFVLLFFIQTGDSISYSIFSINFLIIMIVIGKKLSFKSRILIYFSRYTFEIYIYQRIFFRVYSGLSNNQSLFFILSLVSTLIFSFLIKKLNQILSI